MRTATVYNFLIEANIMASLAILLMIPIRKFLRPRLGSRALCFAWLLVAVRLLCPLALPNPWISEIKSPYNFDPTAIRPIAGQVKVRLEDAVDDVWMRAYDPQGGMESIRNDPWLRGLHEIRSGFPDGRSARFFMGVYLAGVTGVTSWFAVANLLYRRRLKKRRVEPLSGELLETYQVLCAEKGVRPLPVYYADPLNNACLAGLIRPWIALPLAADREQAEQMLRHEICHQKARDPFWTLVSLACCAVHWFNPLVWIAAAMARTDRELRCDGSVTRDMDETGRKRYAETLICAVSRHPAPGMPMLATGMSMTGRKMKTRVKSILQSGRRIPALAIAFCLTTAVLLAGAFATAEMPYPRSAIPNTETADALTAARSAADAVKTEAEAIAIAKEAWKLPALGTDAEGAEWHAEIDPGDRTDPPVYRVTAALPDGNELICSVRVDGSGVCVFENAAVLALRDGMDAPQALVKYDPYRRELKDFVYAFAEQAEPGITARFTEWVDYGNETDGANTFALFEAWYEDPGPDSKTIVVQIQPEVRIVDYYDGVG